MSWRWSYLTIVVSIAASEIAKKIKGSHTKVNEGVDIANKFSFYGKIVYNK